MNDDTEYLMINDDDIRGYTFSPEEMYKLAELARDYLDGKIILKRKQE